MPSLADWVTIKDDRFTLDTNGDRDLDFDFELANDVDLGWRPILMYDLYMPDQPGSRKFVIKINNDNVQATRTYSSLRSETHHEVINSNVIRPGTNNIVFEIPDEDGSDNSSGYLEIGDVVLLYQRAV